MTYGGLPDPGFVVVVYGCQCFNKSELAAKVTCTLDDVTGPFIIFLKNGSLVYAIKEF